MSTHDLTNDGDGDDDSDGDRKLICLRRQSATANNGCSVRVTVPAKLIDTLDTDPDSVDSVVVKAYDDGTVTITL